MLSIVIDTDNMPPCKEAAIILHRMEANLHNLTVLYHQHPEELREALPMLNDLKNGMGRLISEMHRADIKLGAVWK